tara:strand:- start:76 stop:294 length:219 start_codon:yes stop_codon:yes gene_type:complete
LSNSAKPFFLPRHGVAALPRLVSGEDDVAEEDGADVIARRARDAREIACDDATRMMMTTVGVARVGMTRHDS